MKKFLYTIFTTVLFTTTAFRQGEQRYANGSAIDQDGSTFEWINYGTQDWAIENAEVVTYRDGTAIPQVTDATEWSNLTTGAWSYY
ncbi:MAG: fibrobacter succinogenes major paralogous domain-containing protein, partial [Flavobacteriales bacterium]|nr:fibrobacter succinogenes major paralogous domain-containing protein [Flavobacteriales bacterium]